MGTWWSSGGEEMESHREVNPDVELESDMSDEVIVDVEVKPVSSDPLPSSETKTRRCSCNCLFIYLCWWLTGVSAWLCVNGFFTQIPIFIRETPESYKIVSGLVLALSLTNGYVLVYFLVSLCCSSRIMFILDTVTTYALYLIGIVFALLLGGLWTRATPGGLSICLYSFMHFVGATNFLSSVVYFPLVMRYRPVFTSALQSGFGLSGLIAGWIAIGQQPGKEEPNFSVFAFSGVLAAILVVSCIGFSLLRWTSCGRREMVRSSAVVDEEKEEEEEEKEKGEEGEAGVLEPQSRPFIWPTVRLVLMMGLICAIQSGVLNVAAPYLLSGYPHSSVLLSFAINISLIVDPIFCAIANFLPAFYRCNCVAITLNSAWILLAIFQFALSVVVSKPFLDSHAFGIFLIVVRVVCRALVAYCETSELLLVHRLIKEDSTFEGFGKCALSPFRIAGFGTQVGSVVGSITMFLLDRFSVFKQF